MNGGDVNGSNSSSSIDVSLDVSVMTEENSFDNSIQIISGGEMHASAVVDKRISNETRKMYLTTYKFIIKHCQVHMIDALTLDRSNLMFPMSLKHAKEFMGEVAREREDGTVKAKATLDNYSTVIKHYHKELNVEIAKDVYKFLQEFSEGFKRVVANKKDLGIMKNFEGKVAISMLVYSSLCKIALFASEDRLIPQ